MNRREFENRLERALKSAKAREASYALCYLDIDQFKIVNDTCGHSAGDALLGQVGALLKSKVRWRDTLSRLGGDEFGILLESCSLDEAMRMAETLRDSCAQLPLHLGGPRLQARRQRRRGADHRRERGRGLDPVCGRQRLRRRQGERPQPRAQLRRERHGAHAAAASEMQWAARINAALEEGRFELFRMTILPLQRAETGAHYELLLRMKRRERAHRRPR